MVSATATSFMRPRSSCNRASFLKNFFLRLAVEDTAEEIERVAQALERDPHVVAFRFRQRFEPVSSLQQLLMRLRQRARRQFRQRLIEAWAILSGLAEIVGVGERAEVDQEVPVARRGQCLADVPVCAGLLRFQAGHQRSQLLRRSQCLDGGLEQFGLQNIEIARRPQDLAEPADSVLDRLDALAAQQGPVDLECGTQAPQRNAALMHAFDVEIEPCAVVVRGEMGE